MKSRPASPYSVRKLSVAALLALGSCAAGFGVARLATADTAAGAPAYNIPQAAGVYLTERGQRYFVKHELAKILERNRIDLTRGALPIWKYDATEPFRLSRLPKDIRAKVVQVREALDEWLGLELGNPRFHAVVKDAGYTIEGLELGVRVDRELTEKRNARLGTDGVVLVAELTIPKLRAQAQSICGYDSNNTLFGRCRESRKHPDRYVDGFGVYNPWIELRDEAPLKISVPIHARVLPQGHLSLEVFRRDGVALTNLESLEFANGHDRDLLIPSVTLQVGTRKMTPDPAELRKALTRKERELVKIGLHHLHGFIEEELPTRLNQILLDQLKQSFESVKDIDPPSPSLFSLRTPLKWGMRPASLGLARDFLYFLLEGYVMDPATGTNPSVPARALNFPSFEAMDKDEFDFAVALNLDVVNHIIQLSRKRGGLGWVSGGGAGGRIKLAETPVMSAGPDRKGRIHATIEMPTDGAKQWVALKDPFQVELDVKLRVEPASLHSFHLVMEEIDEDTAYIPSRFIDHFSGSVAGTLRGRIRAINAGYARATENLTDAPLELPAEIMGLPLRLLKGEFDSSGFLILYFAYGDRF